LSKNISIKKNATIGCCGLDCGLCPTFYTIGPSRCPGCCGPDFFNKHPSCSIITCCVKKHEFETCADCDEFPCSKLKDWDIYDSFICHRISLSNLKFIKESDIGNFVEQQKNRIMQLEEMLESFNEGRSKSFYCISSALLPIHDLEQALKNTKEKIKQNQVKDSDIKSKSKILKQFLKQYADKQSIELKLRKN